MTSDNTGVTAHILTADWVQKQAVVSGCVFQGHRLSVLVPDEGGVVTQNTGCITGRPFNYFDNEMCVHVALCPPSHNIFSSSAGVDNS